MTILTRYILNEFFRILFLAIASMMSLYVVIDFFEKIDEYVVFKATVLQCLGYYFFKLPLIAFFMAPVAFLLATVITIGSFSKSNELTAMKSCGLSLMHVTGPILLASIAISIFTLLSNEFIVPFTTRKANHIFNVQIRKERLQGMQQRDKIWYRSNDGAVWQIGVFNPKKQEMQNISIFKYQGGKNLSERVDASKAIWSNGDWIFFNGSIRTFDESGTKDTDTFTKRKIYFPVNLEDFNQVKTRKEEMTLRELFAFAQKVKKEGMDNSRYLVDFHHKISYPFISLITALIGVPFSLKSARSGGVIFCVGLSIILGFSYYFIFSLGISLGYGGTLPPFLAAWGTNLIFAALGLYFILTIDSENLLPSFSFNKKSPDTAASGKK